MVVRKLGSKRISVAWTVVAVSGLLLCLAGRAEAATTVPGGGAASGPVPLIVDTDIFSDADDVGALATAFALQLRGEAKVIAVAVNTRTDRPAVATNSWKCVAAIDSFYGFPDVPIGTQMPNDGTAVNTPDFVGPCAQLAPASTPVPDTAVNVYRRALASQADDSVVIASTGYLSNLADLLNSPPDAISPLSGRELVAEKVRTLVVMGGGYPSPSPYSPENNLAGDPAAAQDVSANWPSKIVWSGYEVGNAVHTGSTISSTHPADSPVRVAYEAYTGGPNNWIPSWDLTAVYHAVRPTDPLLSEVGPGTNAIDAGGGNTFTMGSGNQYYLTLSDPTALDGSIEALLDTLPQTPLAGQISGTVLDASTNEAIPGVDVQAYDSAGTVVAAAQTAADGTYTLSGLPPGGYEVAFSPGSGYLPQFYSGQSTLATADPVWVTADSTATGVNAALALAPQPPSNSAAPTISGTAQPGQTLTESHGSWSNGPTGFTYQWEDCDATGASCSAIAGATSQTYTVAASDVGSTIRVEEFASNAAGTSSPATSGATEVVQLPSPPPTSPPPTSPPPTSPPPTSPPTSPPTPPPTSPPPTSPPPTLPSSTSPPVISGRAAVGQTLTSSNGAWSGTRPIFYAFQWQRCHPACSDIRGATRNSYTLTTADQGAKVRVLVTATNHEGKRQAASNEFGPIAAATVSSARIRALLARVLAAHGNGARIKALLKASGYWFSFTAPSPGHLMIAWYHPSKHRRNVLVARVSVIFHAARTARLKLVLTSAGRKLLRSASTLKLTTKASFTPVGQASTSTTKTLELRPGVSASHRT